jgi:hypothetical protein
MIWPCTSSASPTFVLKLASPIRHRLKRDLAGGHLQLGVRRCLLPQRA